jgi:hypothetical protein
MAHGGRNPYRRGLWRQAAAGPSPRSGPLAAPCRRGSWRFPCEPPWRTTVGCQICKNFKRSYSFAKWYIYIYILEWILYQRCCMCWLLCLPPNSFSPNLCLDQSAAHYPAEGTATPTLPAPFLGRMRRVSLRAEVCSPLNKTAQDNNSRDSASSLLAIFLPGGSIAVLPRLCLLVAHRWI